MQQFHYHNTLLLMPIVGSKIFKTIKMTDGKILSGFLLKHIFFVRLMRLYVIGNIEKTLISQ